MAPVLSQSEIQEITRLLEHGKALPEKYRDVLFVEQQLHSEDSTPANPEPTALDCVAKIAGREGESEIHIRAELMKGGIYLHKRRRHQADERLRLKELLRIREILPAIFPEQTQAETPARCRCTLTRT
jgi:hypothetical protein